MALPFQSKGSIEEALANHGRDKPGDSPPDAAWYEQQRLKAQARAAGVSPAIMAAAAAAASDAAIKAPVPDADGTPAWQKVGRALGDIAGQVVGTMKRRIGRRFTPKMRQADVKTKPGRVIPPPEHWVRDMIAAFKRTRVPGIDISVAYFRLLAEKGFIKVANDGRGFVQRSFRGLATLADMGRETARKGVDWMRDNGWLGTLNSLSRDNADTARDETRRDKYEANVYFLLNRTETAEVVGAPPEARASKWEAVTLARGAVLFGLFPRDGGLNRSPARFERDATRTSPAPA
jgi:hypothetical protein